MKTITKINQLMIIIIFLTHILPNCDGFNWYHEINIDNCNKKDLSVLQAFIDNSKSSINFEMDINLNSTIEPLELGWQLWENGRLIHWICTDVPSPFYVYNYDCGLSGNIPENINLFDSIIKLHIQNNNLDGLIPKSICDLNISKSNNYWFKIDNNKLCPPYPDCIGKSSVKQIKNKCD